MDILGLSTSPGSGGAYALILTEKEGNKRLPIIIGAFEAQAIALELEQIKPPRPMTHDLLKNAILSHGSAVEEVMIHELHEGTFFAQLKIRTSGSVIELDARPSDAIALSIRFHAPIFVDESILEEAGIEADEQNESDVGAESQRERHTRPAREPLNRMEQLEKELRLAIETENYEKAATIRDQINQLKG